MSAPTVPNGRTGFRGNGPTYQDLLDLDSKPVPASLRRNEPGYFGDADIPVERYLSREFHELEKARLWSRVWQFACREEVLTEVGDTEIYDICDTSILLELSTNTYNAYTNWGGSSLYAYHGRAGLQAWRGSPVDPERPRRPLALTRRRRAHPAHQPGGG